jgi:hypothetical protein
MGIAHGVAIGVATVTKTFRGRPYVGIVDSFRAPWFHVTYSDGDEEDLHGLELARLLNYRAATFYEPEFFNYDFSVLHPATIPGWCAAMREFLCAARPTPTTIMARRCRGPTARHLHGRLL